MIKRFAGEIVITGESELIFYDAKIANRKHTNKESRNLTGTACADFKLVAICSVKLSRALT